MLGKSRNLGIGWSLHIPIGLWNDYFTLKMTHTVTVFDLIAFVIIIINDNNSAAVMPQGFSWDQGSVLIGIELTEETNLALRSLHLSWRRQMQAGGSIFNSLLKTERLNDLLEAEGAQGLCPKPLGDRGPNWGTPLLAILTSWVVPT